MTEVFQKLTIISGGQTGADRAALDFALKHHMACGGYCPKGRLAEDGPIHPQYPLQETSTALYRDRTVKNIVSSDGTLILYTAKFDAGTALTLHYCKKINKPCLVLKLDGAIYTAQVKQWMKHNNIQVLNIAGPRESSNAGIYREVFRFLTHLFSQQPDVSGGNQNLLLFE